MTSLTRVAAMAAMTVVLGAASAAEARIVTTTFTGVAWGIDYTGLFGAAERDLSGSLFTAVFTTDDALGVLTDDGVAYSQASGGLWAGAPQIASGTLTIDGHSFTMGGALTSYLYAVKGADYDEFGVLVGPGNPGGFEHFRLTAQAVGMLGDQHYWQTFSYAGPFLPPSGSTEPNELALVDNNVQLNILSVANSATPEPATWAMMLGGFGIAGVSLRRRRAMVAA